MNKPTIGRIVHYKLNESDKKFLDDWQTHKQHNNVPDVLPAIITAVWGDTCINVQVIVDGQSGMMWKTSIIQGDGEGHWNWPVRE